MPYNFTIYTRHGWVNDVRVFYPEPRSLMLTGTADSALRSLDYYRAGEDTRYTDAFVTVEGRCDECNGAGRIAHKRVRHKFRDCKACKATGIVEEEKYISREELEAMVREEAA